jgi:hypothetical protein
LRSRRIWRRTVAERLFADHSQYGERLIGNDRLDSCSQFECAFRYRIEWGNEYGRHSDDRYGIDRRRGACHDRNGRHKHRNHHYDRNGRDNDDRNFSDDFNGCGDNRNNRDTVGNRRGHTRPRDRGRAICNPSAGRIYPDHAAVRRQPG